MRREWRESELKKVDREHRVKKWTTKVECENAEKKWSKKMTR